MEREKRLDKIIISFLAFVALFVLNLFFPAFANINHTARMWIIFDLCVVLISTFLIIKYKLPNKSKIISALILGLLMFIAYQGVSFSSIKSFITTTVCSLASFSVFEKHQINAIPTIKSKQINSIVLSILLGFGVGGILGTINLFLSGEAVYFRLTISCFLTSLSPAILEEICYRTLVFAYCIYLLKGVIKTKQENIWCYIMIVIPHVLIHTPDTFLTYGLVSGVVSIVILSLIFGMPLAILQRKRDLTSAMVAHGTVDVIRFSFLGLPF